MQLDDRIGSFTLRAILFFVVSVVLAIAAAIGVGRYASAQFEKETYRSVETALPIRDVGWLITNTDGLVVTLAGQAPDDAAHRRVIEAVSKEININRIIDNIEIPQLETAAPKVLLEVIQNDKISSVLGLVPREPSPLPIYRAMAKAHPGITPLNIVQNTDADVTGPWEQQIAFVSAVVEKIDNVKVSVTPDTATVSAIVKSDSEAEALKEELLALAPNGIELDLNITAPRPLVVPFQLTINHKNGAYTLGACSANDLNDAAKFAKIIKIGNEELEKRCDFGLGAPTDNWGLFVSSALEAVQDIEEFDLKMVDNHVEFAYSSDSDPATVEATLANLRGLLPPGFGLTETTFLTTKTIEEIKAEGSELALKMVKDEDGTVNIEGAVANEIALNSLKSYGEAIFGTGEINYELNVVEGLDANWESNSFAGMNALQSLNFGEVTVKRELISVNGEIFQKSEEFNIIKVLEEESRDVAITTDIMALNVTPPLQTDKKTVIENANAPINDQPIEIAPEICVEQIAFLVKASPIVFEPSASELVENSRGTIDQIATELEKCGDIQIEIAGHTDSQGSESGNLRLSTERAEAVRAAIIELLPEATGRINAKGYGEIDPIADNNTADGRSKNRRIEFNLIDTSAEARE